MVCLCAEEPERGRGVVDGEGPLAEEGAVGGNGDKARVDAGFVAGGGERGLGRRLGGGLDGRGRTGMGTYVVLGATAEGRERGRLCERRRTYNEKVTVSPSRAVTLQTSSDGT